MKLSKSQHYDIVIYRVDCRSGKHKYSISRAFTAPEIEHRDCVAYKLWEMRREIRAAISRNEVSRRDDYWVDIS